jgi:hypothetical protein
MSSTVQVSIKSAAHKRLDRARYAYTTWIYAACVCLVAVASESLWHAASTIQVVA